MREGFTRRAFVVTLGSMLMLRRTRSAQAATRKTVFNVTDFGAQGDGTTFDTDAINHAIAAAADAGGGVVELPAGRYLCFTIHLRSHTTLRLSPGAVVIAATPKFDSSPEKYDLPEPQPASVQPYQDYGHNHWHNSLLWGEDLDGVTITGPGEIWGRGLEKGDGAAEERPGASNKVIALKRCRNVVLRDISIRQAGHFGVLATGVDNLTIDGLRIDTQRDGIDIDACRDVHIRGCSVNSPWDDAIVLKSSYSLGGPRSTERVTISDCTVTGSYKLGSTLDGTDLPAPEGAAGEWPAHVGRIKIGTETDGDLRNIVVSNCVFEGCHGIAVISEDGGIVEDVLFSNITMRNMVGPPVFVRLGGRMREPAPVKPSIIRRIGFHQIDCVSSTSDNCSIIAGIPGHPVESIVVSELRVRHPGNGTPRTDAVPEQIANYPEPGMFGETPAHGFYLRHAQQIELRQVVIDPITPDKRPLVWMDDVRGVFFEEVRSTQPSSSIDGIRITDIQYSDPAAPLR